jgi:hypothetical protein
MGLYPVGVELLLGLPTLPAVGLAVEAWVGALLHNTPQPSYPRLTHIIPAIPGHWVATIAPTGTTSMKGN